MLSLTFLVASPLDRPVSRAAAPEGNVGRHVKVIVNLVKEIL